ncbi:uncharacterized protein [Ptychodera flava]|uniref:uncharacterized protein isoform X2 n=1 Tax=Ptychodera flava TaxID=63121 RepID=UPI00396A2DF2
MTRRALRLLWPLRHFRDKVLLGKRALSALHVMENVETKLEERWGKLVPNPSASTWWQKLKSKYSEHGRYYHSLYHLQDMFHHFDQEKDKIKSQESVQLAIFFHDMVYDPKAGDNEEQSADMFLEFAKTHMSGKEDTVKNVKEYILITKTHLTEAHQDEKIFGTDDLHYFLDMDMAVLGWPQNEYQCYSKGIRQEYIHIPEEKYRVGRAAVLKSFLERKNIYATKEFREKFEKRARSNVEQEIRNLEDPKFNIEGLPGVRQELCTH